MHTEQACRVCERKFRDNPALWQHINATNHFRAWCKTCDKEFNSAAALKQYLDNSSAHQPQGRTSGSTGPLQRRNRTSHNAGQEDDDVEEVPRSVARYPLLSGNPGQLASGTLIHTSTSIEHYGQHMAQPPYRDYRPCYQPNLQQPAAVGVQATTRVQSYNQYPAGHSYNIHNSNSMVIQPQPPRLPPQGPPPMGPSMRPPPPNWCSQEYNEYGRENRAYIRMATKPSDPCVVM
ncbi:Fc.00g008560.m01.CDS01 [Cosmosporella sp. VM-42]